MTTKWTVMWCAAATVLLGAVERSPLAAQEPPAARRQQLQEQVMQRFMENVRQRAELTDEQGARFEQVTRRMFEQRGELQRRERELWRAIEGQMRPSVAADADSVARLLDALSELQLARAQQARREQQVYAEFLSPVQRAQVTMAVTRLQHLIEDRMRMRRGPRGREGPRPGGPPGRRPDRRPPGMDGPPR